MSTDQKPKLGRPVGANRAELTRFNILSAAIRCFAESGYGGTTNKEIAEEAGITTGTLYHYYSSKAVLYIAALEEVLEQVIEEYRNAAELAVDSVFSLRISQGIEGVIRLAKTRPGIMRFAALATIEIEWNEALWSRTQGQRDDFTPFFLTLLQEAQVRGELAADTDIDSVAKALTACFMGLAQVYPAFSRAEYSKVLRAFEAILQGEIQIHRSNGR